MNASARNLHSSKVSVDYKSQIRHNSEIKHSPRDNIFEEDEDLESSSSSSDGFRTDQSPLDLDINFEKHNKNVD